jgi:hypothetical protein
MSAISEFQEWFKGNWDYYNDRKFDRAPAKSAWMHQQKIIDSLEDRLIRSGFVRCDLTACNCGSWHQRYGLPERMREIRETITEAGHPPNNENGNSILRALIELIEESEMDKAVLYEAYKSSATRLTYDEWRNDFITGMVK